MFIALRNQPPLLGVCRVSKLFMLIKGCVTGEAKIICESAEDDMAREGLEL